MDNFTVQAVEAIAIVAVALTAVVIWGADSTPDDSHRVIFKRVGVTRRSGRRSLQKASRRQHRLAARKGRKARQRRGRPSAHRLRGQACPLAGRDLALAALMARGEAVGLSRQEMAALAYRRPLAMVAQAVISAEKAAARGGASYTFARLNDGEGVAPGVKPRVRPAPPVKRVRPAPPRKRARLPRPILRWDRVRPAAPVKRPMVVKAPAPILRVSKPAPKLQPTKALARAMARPAYLKAKSQPSVRPMTAVYALAGGVS
jgi:hypothetical protein